MCHISYLIDLCQVYLNYMSTVNIAFLELEAIIYNKSLDLPILWQYDFPFFSFHLVVSSWSLKLLIKTRPALIDRHLTTGEVPSAAKRNLWAGIELPTFEQVHAAIPLHSSDNIYLQAWKAFPVFCRSMSYQIHKNRASGFPLPRPVITLSRHHTQIRFAASWIGVEHGQIWHGWLPDNDVYAMQEESCGYAPDFGHIFVESTFSPNGKNERKSVSAHELPLLVNMSRSCDST